MDLPSELHLSDYFRIIRQRIWVVLLFFFVVVTVVAIGTFRATPIYRATTRLIVESPHRKSLPYPETRIYQYSEIDRFFQTQYGLLKGKKVVSDLIDELNMMNWAEYKGLDRSETSERIIKNITVEPEEESFLVDLSFDSPDPKKAELVVNNLAEIFIDLNRERNERDVKERERIVQEILPKIREKIEKCRQILKEFKMNNNVLAFEGQREIIRSRHREISTILVGLDRELVGLEAIHQAIEEVKKRGEDFLSIPLIYESAEISRLREELSLLDKQLEEIKNKPSYKVQDFNRIAALQMVKQEEIEREKEIILANFSAKLHTAQEQKRLYEEKLAEQVRLEKELDDKLSEFQMLKDELQFEQDQYNAYFQSFSSLSSRAPGEFLSNNIEVEFRATTPQKPVRPNKLLNLVLSVVIGLFGGIGLAFFFEYLDDTIKDKEDVDRYLNLPSIGFVPAISDGGKESLSRDLMMLENPKSSVSEAFRGIRTGISFTHSSSDKKSILITSCNPQEGKTTAAINLAIAMAQGGYKTLLVDSDLRKPRIHRSFGFDNKKGLTTLFLEDVPVSDLIKKTQVENLYFLASGPIPPNPSEILGSPKMKRLHDELRKEFDKLIFDSPPVIAVSDTMVLGHVTDATVLIIQASDTRKKLALRGKEQLESVGVNVAGVVLNRLKLEKKGYYDQYYHDHRSSEEDNEKGG